MRVLVSLLVSVLVSPRVSCIQSGCCCPVLLSVGWVGFGLRHIEISRFMVCRSAVLSQGLYRVESGC